MNQTTLLFLRSYLSKDRFTDALRWVKAQENRIYLPDIKLWCLDIQTTPADALFEEHLDDIRATGWSIVGSTLWDTSLPLRGNEIALQAIAELAVETVNRHRRNQK